MSTQRWLALFDSKGAKAIATGITRIAAPDDGWRYPPELPPGPMLVEAEWPEGPYFNWFDGQIFHYGYGNIPGRTYEKTIKMALRRRDGNPEPIVRLPSRWRPLDRSWRTLPELPPEPMLCEVEWESTPSLGRPSISYWTGQIFRGCTHRAVAEQSPTLPLGGEMDAVLRWRPADRTEQAEEPESVVLKSEADAAAERKHVRLSDEKGIDSFVAPAPAAAPKPIATPRLNLRQRWWWLP